MIDNISYKVIEDNNNGLHLFVFENGEPIWSSSGFDNDDGAMTDMITAIVEDEHPIEIPRWNGDDHPQAAWDWFGDLEKYPYADSVIIEGDTEGSTINVNVMDYPALVGLISIPVKQKQTS